MFCPNCGQPQLPGFSFCSRCGCKLIKPEDIAAPTSLPEGIQHSNPQPSEEPLAISEAAIVSENVPVENAEVSAASDVCALPDEDPAAIPDEIGSYTPPVQPCATIPCPQYGYSYPDAALQHPPYPNVDVPVPQLPPYPQMHRMLYTPNPYVPYNPSHPWVTPYSQMKPAAPSPAAENVPPVKPGRRRVPIIIMVLLVIAGLLLFFFGRGKEIPHPQSDTAQSKSETPWFRNEDGTLYFDARRYNGPDELTIPETVDGEPVICIAQDCFAGNDTITTVILPKGGEEIGSGAFSDCPKLRGIFIPEGVKSIGSGAFEDCTSLEAIYIPTSVAAIGRNTFRGCSDLKYIMYDGTYEDWYDLYPSYISGKTEVYCSDGTFPQGKIIP